MTNRGLEERCRTEIAELHDFFASWYNGTIERSDEMYSRFSSVLFPQFHMVHPDGGVFDWEQVLEMVRNGCGNYGNGQSLENQKFEIEIRNVEVRTSIDDGNVVLVSYEEWQRTTGPADSTADSEWRGRSSVVLFYADETCPNGLTWASVHERWIKS